MRAEKRRHFHGARALTFESHMQRTKRTMRQPRFHRAWNTAHLCAPRAQLVAPQWVARCDVTKQKVGVAGHGFGV